MDTRPQNPADRLEALERWADEQLQDTGAGTLRFRTRVARRLIGNERLKRSRGRVLRITRLVHRFTSPLRDRGLDTSSRVTLPEHSLDDRVPYVPSSWHFLPRALRYLGVSDRDTFVDFGCGKGRVVHQAARRPFRRVIGVEVSPDLADMARAAVAARRRRHRCGDVEIVVSDVRDFRVPDDLTIGYFFRPFGDETLEAVLRGIVESIDRNPRRVRLIYAWPATSRETILATGRFRVVKEQSSAFYSHTDRVAIFESC